MYNHLFAAFVWFAIYISCTLCQCAGTMVGPLTRPGLATAWSTLLYPKLGTVSVPCHTGHVLPCRPSPTTASLPSTPSSAALQPARTPKGPGPPLPLLFMFFTVCFDVYARTLTICYHFINCAQGPRVPVCLSPLISTHHPLNLPLNHGGLPPGRGAHDCGGGAGHLLAFRPVQPAGCGCSE